MDEIQTIKEMYHKGDTINEIKEEIKKTTYFVVNAIKVNGFLRSPGWIKKNSVHKHAKIPSNRKKATVGKNEFMIEPYPDPSIMKTFEFDCKRLIRINEVYGVAKLRSVNE